MDNNRRKTVGGHIVSLTALIAAAAYLLLGFTIGGWHIYWVLFLSVPVMSIIVDIVSNHKDISGKITGIVAILCVITYMLLGFLLNLWSPGWIVFFAVPISGVIVKIFTDQGSAESSKDESQEQ